VRSLEKLSEAKRARRGELLHLRRSASRENLTEEAQSLREHLRRWTRENGVTTLCAYVPVGREPGSLELLDDLREDGCRVLLPVVVGPEPLDWAEYEGPSSLEKAALGLLEPTGRRVGSGGIGQAQVVLVPALAVDRSGRRLGRGGGHYDRSLPLRSPESKLLAVVRDGEVVDELPGEEHDVPMNAVLTPGAGVRDLPL
jgi:5-formyltetrahydrofolate cyclo-ligase